MVGWVKMDLVFIVLETILSLSSGVDVKSANFVCAHLGIWCPYSFMVKQQVELRVSHYSIHVAALAVSGKTEILSQTLVTNSIFTWLITQENFIAC
jgi:hypothetical protein